MTAVTPTVEDPVQPAPARSGGRHAALAGALGRLKRRRGVELPLARVLLVVGGLCLPAGIVVIVAGWYGVAHTLNVYEQNSYMLSGGFLGLGLIIVGGFLYFGYWMTRQLQVAKVTLQQMGRDFDRVESQLSALTMSVERANLTPPAGYQGPRLEGGVPAVNGARPAGRPAGRLVATEHGSLVHRPDCQVVARKTGLRAVDPGDPALRPCQICQPYGEG